MSYNEEYDINIIAAVIVPVVIILMAVVIVVIIVVCWRCFRKAVSKVNYVRNYQSYHLTNIYVYLCT